MSEFKNSYVCPNCYCSDGWITNMGAHNINTKLLQCKHCQEILRLENILEYNKENKGWFRLE